MADQRDRGRGSDEDLFQDFDQYFAPLEEGERPEEGTPDQAPEEAVSEEGGTAEAGESGAEGEAPEAPAVEPSDFDLDIPDPDELVAELPAEPVAPEPPPGAVVPPDVPEEEGLEAAFDRAEAELEGGGPEAPTAEEARVEEVAEEASAPSGPEAPSAEDLSVDDLRTPPPQYADLPRPEEEGALESAGEPGPTEEHGEVRLEGKEYVVQDGDIINFRHAT